MEDIGSRLGGSHDMTPRASQSKKNEKPESGISHDGLTPEQKAYKDGYRKGKLRGNLETLIAIFIVTAVIVALAV